MHTPLELCCQLRELLGVAHEALLPALVRSGTTLMGIPTRTQLVRYHEWLVHPLQVLTGRSHLGSTKGCTMRGFRPLLVGRPETNDGFAANQARAVGLGLGSPYC